ncbi:MAG: hypothetical protein WDM87_08245, partial [Terracidiphilus sp.]
WSILAGTNLMLRILTLMLSILHILLRLEGRGPKKKGTNGLRRQGQPTANRNWKIEEKEARIIDP